MTFYWSSSVTILFDEWAPATMGEYFGALVAVFFLGVAYELTRFLAHSLDKSLLAQSARASNDHSVLIEKRHVNGSGSSRVNFGLFDQLKRALLHMIQLTLAYLLMLVVMTYNGGLFIAAIVGSGVARSWIQARRSATNDPIPLAASHEAALDLSTSDLGGDRCHTDPDESSMTLATTPVQPSVAGIRTLSVTRAYQPLRDQSDHLDDLASGGDDDLFAATSPS
ncbi:hypothetical protein CAOG_009740 [Capsaspora owczarzaki ATCC 30864]|uniref:Copper transport protein n=1 Tax=Capsaspora owczarzaki (strain ATCC 30864) TaxID=595528 RepID=A0A0D2UDT0_CAPO3|nr:hypothetical protein CAOG_009740 [Capsaspora owczarzaki ATCC 30864]